MKMMRSSLTEVLHSDFVTYARLLGLPSRTVARYALRNALPPVVTIIGFLYGFLLGGAVLVETVFGWGGLGQYVTMAISNKDYAAIQGFVLFASVFSLIVYLVVDLIYMAIDPRIEVPEIAAWKRSEESYLLPGQEADRHHRPKSGADDDPGGSVCSPAVRLRSPEQISADNRMPPNLRHLFGTDETGMDIFTRVIYAARIDINIGLLGTLISLAIGIPIGMLVRGYYERMFGEVVMRLADLVQAFPVFILAMALVAALGNKIENVILAIAFVNAPIYLRLVRTEVLSIKHRPFVEAARCGGLGNFGIMFRDLLPNSVRPALIQASVNVGWAILLTAGLSFIGAGVQVPTPEWGSMISIGASTIITGQWWASFFPGLAIMVTVLGFALFGDFLRGYLDPERR